MLSFTLSHVVHSTLLVQYCTVLYQTTETTQATDDPCAYITVWSLTVIIPAYTRYENNIVESSGGLAESSHPVAIRT